MTLRKEKPDLPEKFVRVSWLAIAQHPVVTARGASTVSSMNACDWPVGARAYWGHSYNSAGVD